MVICYVQKYNYDYDRVNVLITKYDIGWSFIQHLIVFRILTDNCKVSHFKVYLICDMWRGYFLISLLARVYS